ncbi:hypothetical protein B296_00011729 [Ensete ventricosum]|uniref:Uncharacterized protein n=1 Tax=Ensete ventricosum TaxID=4639 RepID=A0A426ZVS1_ENSVE|nr:hypothetical protein B296_00011729 [Ensete ventricosum]
MREMLPTKAGQQQQGDNSHRSRVASHRFGGCGQSWQRRSDFLQMAIDFDSDISLVEKEQTILLEPSSKIRLDQTIIGLSCPRKIKLM